MTRYSVIYNGATMFIAAHRVEMVGNICVMYNDCHSVIAAFPIADIVLFPDQSTN